VIGKEVEGRSIMTGEVCFGFPRRGGRGARQSEKEGEGRVQPERRDPRKEKRKDVPARVDEAFSTKKIKKKGHQKRKKYTVEQGRVGHRVPGSGTKKKEPTELGGDGRVGFEKRIDTSRCSVVVRAGDALPAQTRGRLKSKRRYPNPGGELRGASKGGGEIVRGKFGACIRVGWKPGGDA